MANAIYPKYKEAMLSGSSGISLTTGTVRVSLVDSAEIVFNAAHEFQSDLNAAGIISTAIINNVTVTDGLFDGDDVTLPSVTGDEAEALIVWIDSGVTSTSRLVAYIDTGISGMPITPNGSDIDIEWNVSGIFQL